MSHFTLKFQDPKVKRAFEKYFKAWERKRKADKVADRALANYLKVAKRCRCKESMDE